MPAAHDNEIIVTQC